jgi:hypothetical protein
MLVDEKPLDKFYNQADLPCVHLIKEKYYSNVLPPVKKAD